MRGLVAGRGQNDAFLILIFHFAVERAQVGIFVGHEENFT